MADTGKPVQIEFIANLLRKGKDRPYIVAQFGTKWPKVPERTFKRRLKAATVIIEEETKTKEEIRKETLGEELKAEIRAQIATEDEIDLILSHIVTGNIQVMTYLNDKPVIRDCQPHEIIAAAKELYKRKGSYAPTKTANVNPDGSPVDHSKETIIIYKDVPPMVKKED